MAENRPLDDARAARRNGDYKAAETLCREILDRNPVDAEAAGFLGQCLAELGDVKAARKHVEMALGLAPSSADVRLNAAVLKEREGDLKAAIAEALEASKLDDRKFEVWATLGNFFGKAGLFEKAAAALTNACNLNQKHPGAALLLAGARMELKDYAGADKALDLVEAAAPNLSQTFTIRTQLARARNDFAAIERIATAWLSAFPEEEEARVALAFSLAQQGYYRRAADAYRPLAEGDSPRAVHVAALGRYVLGARAVDEAIAIFKEAIALDPNCAEALLGLSRANMFLGRFDEAKDACRRALAAEPRHVEALAQLVELTGGNLAPAELDRLFAIARDRALAEDSRPTALYALGDALDRRGDRDGAFKAWSEANAARRAESARSAGGAYDPKRQEAIAARLRELFPAPPPAAKAPTDGAPIPIFIVGMPRSGTTLLESAIAAHPDVGGGGEVPALPYIFEQFLDWANPIRGRHVSIPAHLIEGWRDLYFRQIDEFGVRKAPYSTDKQPTNFLAVGLIAHLFPGARIIHIRRNPIETGFSIFKRNFSRQWPFAHAQESIGHYYGQYADLMAHWEEKHPDALVFVQYEALVADFEIELRRLLDHIGLSWNDACLNAHEADRPVITFSATQVRKPASKDHLGASAPYKDQLEPLRRALIDAGVDLATGAKARSAPAPGERLH